MKKDKLRSLVEKNKAIKGENKLLITENVKFEKDLFSALEIKQNARSTYQYSYKVTTRDSEVIPLIILSDFHIEEEVTKASVNGLNEYTVSIAERRVKNLFQNALRLLIKEEADSKIVTAVIALLGDFISGNIHDVLLPICKLQPMTAILRVQDMLISGITLLLEKTKYNFIIPCTVGNHSRITPKVWIATENGYSLEYMMYHSMKSHFKGNRRVTFVISEGQHCYLDVFNYKLRFLHGTQFKYSNGLGGFTIPVMKKVQKWDSAIPAYYTFAGHLHQFFDGNPRFLINGSLIGYGTYAMAIGAEFQKPCQSFVVISKKWGKVGVSPIFVD